MNFSFFTEKVEMKGKKVFFEDPHTPMSQPRIKYDGVPFIIIGKRVYDCHQGIDRHVADKQRRKSAKVTHKLILEIVPLFLQVYVLPSCKSALYL